MVRSFNVVKYVHSTLHCQNWPLSTI